MRCWRIAPEGVELLVAHWCPLRQYLGEQAGQQHQQRTEEHGQAKHPRSPRRSRVPTQVAQALDTLCLTPQAPVELVRAARRVYSKLNHPDASGDTATMQALNVAADVAEAWLTDQRKSASA